MFVVLSLVLCTFLVLFACEMENEDFSNSGDGVVDGDSIPVSITLMSGDDMLKQVTTVGEFLSYVPEKVGYTFDGWYLNKNLTEAMVDTPTEEAILYAKWKIKTFTVRFINYDGTALKVNGENYQTVEYGKAAVAPEEIPTREGYTFNGWDKEFNIITSDTQIRPKFTKPYYSVILYGQDGSTIVKEEKIQVGAELSDTMEDFIKFAENNIKGGFLFGGICADKELTTAFIYPDTMPEMDLVMYTKVSLQGITNLQITSDRFENSYHYDKKGFVLTGSFSENQIEGLTYSYEWITDGNIIEGANGKQLVVDTRDVGEYYYDFVVTATYGDFEPQVASTSIAINVFPGSLEELPEEEQIGMKWESNLVYTGKIIEPKFTNLLDIDTVYYKFITENDYSTVSPVRNYREDGYSIDVKVERPNYEPLIFNNTFVSVSKAELLASLSIGNVDSQGNGDAYLVEYGSELPEAQVKVTGFVGNDTSASVLQWGNKNESGDTLYVTNYAQYAPVLEEGKYYSISIDPNTWATPKNYFFSSDSWSNFVKIVVTQKSLVIKINSLTKTYGDVKPEISEFSVVLGNEDQTGLPLVGFEETINTIIKKSYVCSYDQGDIVDDYVITLDFNNESLSQSEKDTINSYAVSITDGTLSVEPKSATLTPIDVNVVYGDQIPTYIFKVEGLVEAFKHKIEDLGDVRANCDYQYKSNVGTYQISINEDSITNKNYKVSCGTANLKVVPKKAKLKLGSTDIKYFDGYPDKAVFADLLTAEGLVDGDTIVKDLAKAPNFTSGYAIGQPVGEYKVTINGYYSNNYNLELVHGTLIVEKADMSISINDAEIVYGDKFVPKLVYKGLFGDEKENPAEAFITIGSISGYEKEDGVGSYTVTASGYEATNYNISYESAVLTIVQRKITLTVDAKSITYGDENPEFTYSLKAYEEGKEVFAEGEDINTLGTLVLTATNYLGNAGIYDIVASGLESDNYAINITNAKLTVSKKAVTVTPDNIGVTYGDSIPTYTFKADGLVNEETIDVLGTPEAVCAYVFKSNVGNYPITIKQGSLASDNYTITLAQGTLSVAKKDAVLNLADSTITYYDNYPTNNQFADKLSAEGLVEGDTIARTLWTSEAKFSSEYAVGNNVGNYEVVVSGYASNNYNLTINKGTLIVEKASLTVTVVDDEIIYGNGYTASVNYQGFLGNDTKEVVKDLTFSGYNNGGVKEYTINATANADNYDITFVSGKLNVVKRNIYLTVESKGITYGDEEPEYTYTIKGYQDGQDIFAEGEDINTLGTLSLTATNYLGNAGIYDIVASGLESDNYAINITNAKLTVSKKAVTVTPDNIGVTYGDSIPTYTFKADGLVNEETIDVLGTPEAVCAYVFKSNVGNYPITIKQGSLASDNYTITLAQGTLSVAKKDAVLNLADSTITYYDSYPTNNQFADKLSAVGLVEGDTIAQNLWTSEAKFSSEYTVGNNVGNYEVVVSGYASNNYNLTINKGTLIVEKRALTITLTDDSIVYGNSYVPTFSYDGLVGSEASNPSLAISDLTVDGYSEGQDVGEYQLVGANAISTNYEITYVSGTLNITKRTLVIKVRDYTDEEVVWSSNVVDNGHTIALGGDGLGEDDVISGVVMTTASAQGAYIAEGSTLGEKFAWDENNALNITNNGASKLDNYVITFDFQVAIATYGVFVNTSASYYDGLAHGLEVSHIFEDPIATVLYSTDGVDYTETPVTRTEVGTTVVYYTIRVYDVYGEVEKEIKDQLNVVVNARPIYLTVDNKGITYGDENPEFTYSLKAYEEGKEVFAEGEDINTLGTLVLTATNYLGNAGIYDIVASGLESDNYAINITNAKLTVSKKAVTVTPDNIGVTYGDSIPTYTFKADGLVNEETIDVLGTPEAVCAYVFKSNVGNYPITIKQGSLASDNYIITLAQGTLSVAKKDAVLNLADSTITYYDSYPTNNQFADKLSAEGLVEGDNIAQTLWTSEAKFSSEYAVGNDVGNYEVVVSGYASNNYNLTINKGTLIVEKASLTVTVVDDEIIYGNGYTASVNYQGFLGNDTKEVVKDLTFSGYNNGGVKEYTINATANADNYDITFVSGKLNVVKRNIYLTVESKGITYGDEEPEYTYTIKGYQDGQDIFAEGEDINTLGTLSLTATNYLGNAGIYDIVASGLESDNYAINITNAKLTVSKKAVTVTPDNIGVTYGDSIPTYTFKADGLVNEETIDVLGTPEAVCAYVFKSNVGNYPITIKQGSLASDNYTITLAQGTLSVAKKDAVLNLADSTITYYDSYPTNNQFADKLSAVGLVEGDTIAQTLWTSEAKFSSEYAVGNDVGNYEVVVSGYASNNYNLTINKGTLIVEKASLTVTVVDDEIIYGNGYTASVNYQGFLGNDTKEVVKDLTFSGYNNGGVKEYTINATANADNYDITFVSGKLNVVKRNIYLTVESKGITYGDEEPEYTYTIKGYQDGQDIFAEGEDINTLGTLSLTATNYLGNAGIYDIVASGLESDNYAINITNAKLTVSKKAVTVTPDNIGVTYGDSIPTYTFKADGLVNEETIDVLGTPEAVCAYVFKSNVGNYPITIKQGSLASDNYTITLAQGILSVAKKDAVLNLADSTITYYDSYPNDNQFASKLTAVGLVEGDTIAQNLWTNDAKFSSTYTVGSNAGEYDVIVSGYQSNNYNLTIVNAKLIVEKASLTITVADDEIIYGNTYVPSISYAGFLGSDTVDTALTDVVISGYNNGGVEKYTISASANAVNYDIVCVNGTLNVIKRNITVTVDAQSITYGESEPTYTYALSSYLEGKSIFADGENIDNIGLTIDLVALEYEGNAGTYDLVAQLSYSAENKKYDNYNWIIVNNEYTVKRANLTVSMKKSSYSIVYGDAMPDFVNETNIIGFVKGETLDSLQTQILFDCIFTEDPTSIAGTYAVTPMLALNNYKITITGTELTVTKRPITLSADAKKVYYYDAKPELTATSSFYAYNNTDISYIGTFDITTTYNKGNNVGSYAITLSNFVSDRYTATLVNSSITVSPYETTVSWCDAVDGSYTYDATDRSSLFSGEYVDVNGNKHEVTISFSANNSTPNAFINAGLYKITASTSDSNYKLLDASREVRIIQARYTADQVEAHASLTGQYSPNKKLKDYTLENNYYWSAPGETPSVSTTEYSAYYNADTENYFPYEDITIELILTPAYVSLSNVSSTVEEAYDFVSQIDKGSTIIRPTYSISTHFYYWIDGSNYEEITAGFDFTFSVDPEFMPGSHVTTLTFSSENYVLNVSNTDLIVYDEETKLYSVDVNYFVKFRSVQWSGDDSALYTPEEALKVATTGTITLLTDTTFATDDAVINRYYQTNDYYTLNSGVTFILPYEKGDTIGNMPVGESGESNKYYENHPEDPCNEITPSLYLTLDIPSCVTFNVSGTLIVGALTGSRATGAYQNGLTGGYSVINLGGNIVANNAVLKIFGYVLGSGKITATGSTEVIENMYLTGWLGGTKSSIKYLGDETLDINKFAITGGDYTDDDPQAFPFNEYELRAIQVNLEINYGASLKGYMKIATSEMSKTILIFTYTIKAKISEAYMTIISSSTGDNGGLIELSSGSKVTKSINNGRVKLELEGAITDGYTTLSVPVLKATVIMKSDSVLFPIDGRTDIVVKSGSFTQDYKFKLLPGATLTVNAGTTYTLNGSTIIYTGDYADTFTDAKPYTQGRGDAQLIVNGTLNVNGAIGGKVTSTVSGGKVVVASGATLSVNSYEIGPVTRNNMDVGLSGVTTTTIKGASQNKTLTLGEDEITATAGTTYTYNGSAWA